MSRFSSESEITEYKYRGDPLVPEPVSQSGLECVLRTIVNAGQWEMRLASFDAGFRCDLVFDAAYFKYVYERETRVQILYDRTPRIGRGLKIFKDFGVQVMSATIKFDVVPVVNLVSFTSYPPTVDQSTGQILMEGLEFSQVMNIFRDRRPVIGSFPVDEHFHKLGPDDIYDFTPKGDAPYATHCVMFMDGGTDKETGREYLKFLNTHGPGFGKKGFGYVYFNRVFQINSEFCFHTLSFKNPPTPPKPSASTSDSVAETHDKKNQFGLTPAALMDPLTQVDYQKTRELQQFLTSHSLSENLDDSAMREIALSKLDLIVKRSIGHIAGRRSQSIKTKNLVLASGSYSLQVHIPSDELELVCVGPPDVSREELFETLHAALREVKEVANLEPFRKEEVICKARSPEEKAVDNQLSASRFLKFELHGIPVVLYYAIVSEVPEVCSAIFQDSVLLLVDEANICNLDRSRSAHRILELVPDIKHFQTTLRYVNFWARKRNLYSKMPGFHMYFVQPREPAFRDVCRFGNLSLLLPRQLVLIITIHLVSLVINKENTSRVLAACA